jgi:hypothetical protein
VGVLTAVYVPARICELGVWRLSSSGGKGTGVITVGYCEACKHPPLIPVLYGSVPGLMRLEKVVIVLSETVCSEGQACTFAPKAIIFVS